MSKRSFCFLALLMIPAAAKGEATDASLKKEVQNAVAAADALALELTAEAGKQLRTVIATFNDSKDDEARLNAAANLAVASPYIDDLIKRFALSELERESILKATKMILNGSAKRMNFERSLSAVERKGIVEGLSQTLGESWGLFSLPIEPATCSPATYTAMKQRLGLSFLAKYGVDISILAGLYEDLHRPIYSARLIQLIDNKKCKSEECLMSRALYAMNLRIMGNESWRKAIDRTLIIREKTMADNGVPLTDVRSFVYKTATKWPECLNRINMELCGRIIRDVTIERGLYLLKTLNRMRPINVDTFKWDQVKTVKGDAVLGESSDGWNQDYAFEEVGGKLRLISGGEDQSIGTNDDIDISAIAAGQTTP